MPNSSNEILFEKFEILECLKKDEHSGVYLALHIYLNKKIILKSLNIESTGDRERSERFKREAKILAKLDHPNIIKVLDFGTYKNFFYISFEYFESKNLRSIINQNTLSEKIIIKLIVQMLNGLAYAHKNEIIHRDLKPENILVDEENHLKISDFGLALTINDNLITSQYSIVGTPCYMSPEQIEGRSLTYKSDLFSLGTVIYELLTKTNPFLGKDVNESIVNLINCSDSKFDEWINNISSEFSALLKNLWKRDPEDRIASAEEALRLINADTVVDYLETKQTSRRKKNKSLFLIPAAAVLILVFVLYRIFLNVDTTPSTNNLLIDTTQNSSSSEKEDRSQLFSKGMKDSLNPSKSVMPPETKREPQFQPIVNDQHKAGENNIPAAAGRGSLKIECLPWAKIFVDSIEFDTTPIEHPLQLVAGLRRLTLVNPAYPDFNTFINIYPDSLIMINFKLDTLFGYLNCKIHPWGEIYINGKKDADTPLLNPIALNPGTYNLTLKNPQYPEYDTLININRMDTLTVTYNFNSQNSL